MRRRAALLLTAAAVSVLATACTSAGAQQQQAPAGRTLFLEAGCGACHTLRDAATTGVVGPDLDRISPTVQHVEKFVTDGGVGMPSFAGLLTREQIRTIGAYVASNAGR